MKKIEYVGERTGTKTIQSVEDKVAGGKEKQNSFNQQERGEKSSTILLTKDTNMEESSESPTGKQTDKEEGRDEIRKGLQINGNEEMAVRMEGAEMLREMVKGKGIIVDKKA